MGLITQSEADACVRFRSGGRQGHVESIFVKLNLSDARALWLKVTFLKECGERGPEVAEAWAIAFNLGKGGKDTRVAIKETWPAAEAHYATDAFRIKVGDVDWRQGRLVGRLGSEDGDQISWDLAFEPSPRGFRHIPYEWMYRGSVPKSKAMSPQVDTRYSGEVCVNGHRTAIQAAAGMLGHNWGMQHAESWTWSHCNLWEDADDVVFEGVTSKVRFGPMPMPLLSVLHLRVDGEAFDLNGIFRALRIKSRPLGLSWRFEAETRELQILGRISGGPERFVGVTYRDPSNAKIHCLNSKIADATLRIRRKTSGRWLDWRAVHSVQTAALEVGDRQRTHGVEIVIP